MHMYVNVHSVNVYTDEKITIDQVIQQLGELIPQWEKLGRAADIQPSVLKEVSKTSMGGRGFHAIAN